MVPKGLIGLDTHFDLVLGAKTLGSETRTLLALDNADKNRATILRGGYHFGNRAVGESNAITYLKSIASLPCRRCTLQPVPLALSL